MNQPHLSIILVSHINIYIAYVRPDMGKAEIHWPATLKVPGVSKREHLPPNAYSYPLFKISNL